MKKLAFTLFTLIALTACEGPQGLPGPPGPPGSSDNIIGTVFEIENVDFNAGNNFSFLGYYADFIPPSIEVYPSDVVLIYLLESVTQDGRDVWSLIPQTFFLGGGATMQYNYNHTLEDFEIYLQGNVDLTTLDPAFTQNQIFRIAILPADYATSMNLDITNYQAVMSVLKTNNPDFEVIRLEK